MKNERVLLTIGSLLLVLGVVFNKSTLSLYFGREFSELSIVKIRIFEGVLLVVALALLVLWVFEATGRWRVLDFLKRNKRQVVMLFLSVVVFLLVFEGVLRVAFPLSPQIGRDYIPRYMFENDPVLGHRMAANFTGRMRTAEYDVAVSTNSEGLRGGESESSIEKKVLVLGDSFAFGVGVEDNETFSEVLERKISEKEDVEVVNAGVGGYGTDQELLYLKEDGLRLNPEVVIVAFFVGNDLTDNIDVSNFSVVEGFFVKDYKSSEKMKLYVMSFLSAKADAVFRSLAKEKKGFDDLFEKKDFYEVYAGSSERTGREWTKTEGLLEEIVALSEENGARVIILSIPSRKFFPLDKEAYGKVKARHRLLEFGKKRNILIIDLVEEFGREKDPLRFYFKEDGHFTREGHEKVADLLVGVLEAKVSYVEKES